MLYKNYTPAKLRHLGGKLGREGVAKEAQECISQYDGSYKGAMELCGKLFVLAEMSTFDSYWEEQTQRGVNNQVDRCCHLMETLEK
tara:strand:+ start:28950 stop:29207 length:258 start_codon:yes stop_codon:yes gene_type:complete